MSLAWLNPLDNLANVAKGIGAAVSPSFGVSTIGNTLQTTVSPSHNYVPNVPNSTSTTTAAPINNTSTPTNNYSAANNITTPQAPVVNPNQSYIDLINGAIDRLPTQLQSAQANIQNQFNTNTNQLQSGYDAAHLQNDQSTAQNGQQFVANKNTINNQASNGLHGLLAVLGAHGAGGSSAAQYAAPNAVAQVASQQRAGAGQTFGQNQQGIDTTWNNYQNGFDNSKKQLADWLTTQNNNAQSTSETTRQGLLQQLMGLQSSTAAAQPFVDQINQSADKVNSLSTFNPTYNGTTPTYTAPNVASYTVNQTGAPVLNAPGNNTGASSPYQFLLNLKDKQQQSNIGF